MRVLQNAKCVATLAALALLVQTLVLARFSVKQVDAQVQEQQLVINGQLNLDLSSKTEEALDKGIPLDVVFDVNLYHQRPIIWDSGLRHWQFQRRIVFHAISNQYLITTRLPGADPHQESFASLQEALTGMGRLNAVELKTGQLDIPADSGLRMEIRARLDIESLPSPLRPVAYTSRSWRLNSGWSSWSVKR